MHTFIKNKIALNTKKINFLSPDKLLPILIAIFSLSITAWTIENIFSNSAIIVAISTISFSLICLIFNISNRIFLTGLLVIGLTEILNYNIKLHNNSSEYLSLPIEYSLIRHSHYQPTRKHPFEDKYFSIKNIGTLYGITGPYLQTDYSPSPRQDIISIDLKKLLDAREHFKKNNNVLTSKKFEYENYDHMIGASKFDSELEKSVGLNTPKIRLVNKVYITKDTTAALQKINDANIYQVPIITVSDSVKLDNVTDIDVIPPYKIEIKDFSDNKIKFFVTNPTTTTLWLLYLDAYNENWRALVDNKSQPIYPANVAFKAIQIKPGAHEVAFVFSRSATIFKIFFVLMIIVAGTFLIAVICYPFNKTNMNIKR